MIELCDLYAWQVAKEEKCLTLGLRKYNLRCSRIFGQNGLELNEFFFFFLDNSSIFEHETDCVCEIMENYSSFCTRKRVCN